MEHESDDDTNFVWFAWYCHKRIGTETSGPEKKKKKKKRTCGDHRNYSIIEIEQTTEKSPGDLRRLAVTQNPVRNHQLTLVLKTLKGVYNNGEFVVLADHSVKIKENKNRVKYLELARELSCRT